MPPPRIVSEPAELLAHLFAAWPETSRKQIRTWLKLGSVAVNGRVITQFNHPLQTGDTVAIRPKGLAAPETDLAAGVRIRHEDEALIVIEKPAGLLSIATPAEPDKTVYAILTDHVRRGNRRGRERVWIVHRLDRETSGLMVFARSEAVQEKLQRNWDAVEKRYFAVVEGAPAQEKGTLDSHLDESDAFKVRAVKESPRTRRALTHFRVAKKGAATTLLELTLETGRRHQIRVQLAEAGCPIVGDGRYGAKTDPIRRLALHANKLKFPHPVSGEEMRFESPLPGDLGRLV
jgi:23S rRNA pseudouridine1911/1915/1917 synthase